LPDSKPAASLDQGLLADFDRDVWKKVPHLEEGRVVNASPLLDLTQVLKDGAKQEFGFDLSGSAFSVYGKLDASLLGGSVKMRPAVQIIREAILSGRLKRGTLVFEATSGNFGIALGQLGKLGLKVVVLVSRKLQPGVLDELEASDVKTVDLDVEICPTPGMKTDPNLLVARIVADNMRDRFSELGLDLGPFDRSRQKVEELLSRQDVINLAKALADAYGGFCPAQYENELNVRAHEEVTGPEIEQQLSALGQTFGEFAVVCAFGTGGTSMGLSRFMESKYAKKAVHVIFPREGQDVAGIRTRNNAAGLKFYQPGIYAGQHDVDFDQARRLMAYLTQKKGLDIGESGALALYAVLQMVNFGLAGRYLVIVADGVKKYEGGLVTESKDDTEGKLEVTAEQAKAHLSSYGEVIWTHPGYIPNDQGAKVVMAAIGDTGNAPPFDVARAIDVAQTVATGQPSPGLKALADKGNGRVLLVCMSGNTSLRVAKILAEKGISAQSLTGGITNLAQADGTPIFSLVKPAS
jgi:cysteine synthase